MRRFLAGLFALLACLALVLSTTLTWTHSVALNTDHYVDLVGNIAAEPEVTDAVADRLANRIVSQIQLSQRLQSILPDRLDPFADAVANAVESRLRDRLQTALASPQFQQVWENANRGFHTLVVRFLRGDTTVVTTQDGYLTINLVPLLGVALQELQSIGIIPADITLPDLSSGQLPPDFVAKLQSFGITVPADFGQLPVVSAPRLEKAQGLVQAFDIIVIGAWVLTAVLILLAVFLARRRIRMALFVAFGSILGFILLGSVINIVRDAVADQAATPEGAAALDALIGVLFADLLSTDRIVILAIATVGVIVFLVARWGTRDASGVGATASGWARANRFDLAIAIGGLVVTYILATATNLGVGAFAAALLMLFLLARLALRPVDTLPAADAGAAPPAGVDPGGAGTAGAGA
jgi:hypothetical protein